VDFPSMKRAHVPLEVRGNFFPRVQALVTWHFGRRRCAIRPFGAHFLEIWASPSMLGVILDRHTLLLQTLTQPQKVPAWSVTLAGKS
jgi:hypothetical protein